MSRYSYHRIVRDMQKSGVLLLGCHWQARAEIRRVLMTLHLRQDELFVKS